MKYLVLLSLLTLTAATGVERGKWVIDYNSQLSIHGQTNVNSFTCFISCYNSVDTLIYEHNRENGQLSFEANKMIIPVYNFNCGNSLITKDFRNTLKAEKNPYLVVSFVTLDKHTSGTKATAALDITLAGVTKKVNVQFELVPKGSFIQLAGKHSVCFNDFQLHAPERMMGLVKVQDDLNVEFNLLIRPL
ncbi:MAG TPA: YceI family protein [Cyclobacteriaceae bacterium]|nr:YceI family protein [Cyclobacteriaceae bacterium]HMV08505.1 YceI family protein [Cyclobacteriaceae bacterium]HMV89216.1 YceI family protein [Cyclobacteriaceae bacterium]HMX01278.1 YceI family protein [Cyclobacteriaceae bacterium]HMX51308.1 YceI family protein [Cyclobacteriaceae bacterium]